MNIYHGRKKSFLSGMSVTVWLIIITVIAFLVGVAILYYNPDSIKYIALQPSSILQGKYIWTFITSMFMHGGVGHLFVNMLSLIFIGSFVERLIGRKRFFWFYMISGLFAGLFFVLIAYVFNSGLDVYAVGASGALFGVGGLLMLLTPNLPVYIMFIPIPIKMKYAMPVMLLVLWLASFIGDIPIGNTAHLGGLIAGLIYGFYLRGKYKRRIQVIRRYYG